MWPFPRRRRTPEREAVDVELKRESVEDRRFRRQLLREGVQAGNRAALQAAAQLGGGRRGFFPPQESFLEEIGKEIIMDRLQGRGDDPVQQLVAQRKALLELRRLEREFGGGGDSGSGMSIELIQAGLAALPALVAVVTGRPLPQPPTEPAYGVTAAAPPRPSLAPERSPESLPAPEAEPETEADNVVYLRPIEVAAILHNLESMDAAQFAGWLLAQRGGRQLAESWAATPDDQLFDLLASLVDNPDYEGSRPVLEWLRTHPDRTLAILAELRVRLAQQDQPPARAGGFF